MIRSFHFSFTILNPLLVLILCILCCTKGCVERERVALLDFKKSFTSAVLESWHFGKHAMNCCKWDGISCDSHTGHIVSLDLSYEGLESSELRPSLLQLQYLRSLNLSGNHFTMRIPSFFGSLSKLTSLKLSYAGFYGVIPPQLGNISHLQTLEFTTTLNEYVDYYINNLFVDNLEWLSRLSSLESLDMSQVNFGEARDWLSVIKNLPVLSSFSCKSCHFPSPNLSSTAALHVNSSSFQKLDLSWSYLDSVAPFPDIFHDMTSLSFVGLPNHQYEDGIFNSIGNLCNLEELHASGSAKNPRLVDIMQALSGCASTSLEVLDLSSMHLIGTIPPILSKFQSLTFLNLIFNWLDNFPNTVPVFPATLTYLYLNDNKLNGVLSNLHFTNITQIDSLYLDNNPNLSVSFNKPLAATEVSLRSCNLGPNFPSWILAQNNSIAVLDISHSMISDAIPFMFWRNVFPSLYYLNFSFNSLSGVVPNIPLELSPSIFWTFDLRSNALSGTIPFFMFIAKSLYLSDNMFNGFAPISTHYNLSTDILIFSKSVVDISNNHLTGTIPDWLGFKTPELSALVLANNSLFGPIPSSIGRFSVHTSSHLYELNLHNNSFSGPLPSFFKSCSELRVLDLSKNRSFGFIPSWMGEVMTQLRVLSLRSNSLTGTLPTSLCHLSSLQVLDTSLNMLSGNILPCIYNFTAMATDINLSTNLPINNTQQLSGLSYCIAFIKWKSQVWQYKILLPLLKLIDLSSNNFSGEIPNGLASLVKLDSVDFSCNSLQGSIPKQIGQLTSLQYFNLSHNRLNGQIPATLADITSLGVLDFSDNSLSGRIPKGTQLQGFDPSAFAGNPGLCGSPLGKCPGDRDDSVQSLQPILVAVGEMEDQQCFYGGLGTGFAFGLLGILASLNWIRKWRFAFFQFAAQFGEWIMLVVALIKSKISRKLRVK